MGNGTGDPASGGAAARGEQGGAGGGGDPRVTDDPPSLWRRAGNFAFYGALLALIAWIALIGIFAIEQIKVRDNLLRGIAAMETETATRKGLLQAGSDGQPSAEERALDEQLVELGLIKQRLTALILTGEMTSRGSLPSIECDLVQLRRGVGAAQPPARPPVECLGDDALHGFARTLTLQPLTERAASGALFAILVITAALGGAVIGISLERRRQSTPELMKTMLRAVGGGIVCYLVLDGGKFPFSSVEVTEYTNPATGSLLGLLAGMFSDRVFTLLRDVVFAFIERLTPRKTGPRSGEEAPATADGAAGAGAGTPSAPATAGPDVDPPPA
jgi:hypothetical protein